MESRFISVMKDERVEASSILKVPEGVDTPSVMKDQISDDCANAIYCTCMCLMAECLAIFQAASDMESWDVNAAECIRLWNHPGSFLESKLLEKIHNSLLEDKKDIGDSKNTENDDLKGEEVMETRNLMIVPGIASELQHLHMAWRRIVTLSFASAIPCPTLSASLTYYDSYRTRKLPVGLIRAQRDFFNASGYSRLEREGWFSTCWIHQHTAEKKRNDQSALALASSEVGEEEEGADPPPKRRRKNLTPLAKQSAEAEHVLEAAEVAILDANEAAV